MEALRSSDPLRIGRFELLRRLGAGGMGEVYLAKSPTADLVAIKVIKPELVSNATFRARFVLEVESLRTAQGPRIARYWAADRGGQQPWLAVEYVPGPTLREHVERQGPLKLRLVAALGAMLAEGLETIHTAGLLHRDLKPQNILLGPDGPRIIDFGLAVLLERDATLTQTGETVGTAHYMSPEQATGRRDLTTATDVYAFGATLLFAVTRRTPYPSAPLHVVIHRILDPDDPPDLTGVPTALTSLLGAMLAFDANARPSIADVARRLHRLVDSDGFAFQSVRQQLVDQTYVAPDLSGLPDDVDDPSADAEDSFVSDPTELVVTPPLRPELVPQPSPTVAVPQPSPTLAMPRAELAWLTDKLRTQYARRATL